MDRWVKLGSDYDGINLGILDDLVNFDGPLYHSPLVLAFGDELGVFVAHRHHLGPGVQRNSRHVVIVADSSCSNDCDVYGLLSQLEFSIGHGTMDLSGLESMDPEILLPTIPLQLVTTERTGPVSALIGCSEKAT